MYSLSGDAENKSRNTPVHKELDLGVPLKRFPYGIMRKRSRWWRNKYDIRGRFSQLVHAVVTKGKTIYLMAATYILMKIPRRK